MKTITVDQLIARGPCWDHDRIRAIAGDKKEWNALEILGISEVGIKELFWVVLHKDLLSDRTIRLFAADCTEHVIYLFEAKFPEDKRPRLAIQAARDFENGKIDDATLYAAGEAAWDAAGEAAWDAAGEAAGAAAWAAAGAAAWEAAGAAARAAAGAAAWAAEGEWQRNRLVELIKEGEK